VSVNRTDRHTIGLEDAGFSATEALISPQAGRTAKVRGAEAGRGKNVQPVPADWKHAQLAA
jgi:hypothetical protein